MIKKTLWIALMLSLLAILSATAHGDEQTTPVEHVPTVATVPNNSSLVAGATGVRQTRSHLPKTASALPLIALLGLGCVGVASGLMMFGKRGSSSAV